MPLRENLRLLAKSPKGAIVVLDFDGVLGASDVVYELFARHKYHKYYGIKSREIANAVMSGAHYAGQKAYAAQTVKYVLNEVVKTGEERITLAEMRDIGKNCQFVPGARKLISSLMRSPRVQDVYMVTAAYRPMAEEIAIRLGLPKQNVFATEIIEEKGIVKGARGEAMGGIHKLDALKQIELRTGAKPNRFIAVGDNIADREMLRHVKNGGGLAIGFSATPDLLSEKLSVIIAGKSIRPVARIAKRFQKRGHKAISKMVSRNIFLQKIFPKIMARLNRPHLFPGSAEGELAKKMAEKSAAFRAKVRAKYVSRPR